MELKERLLFEVSLWFLDEGLVVQELILMLYGEHF